MVNTSVKKLSKSEFWALTATAEDVTYELISGTAIPKMSPKYFHSRSAGKIFMLLQAWATSYGRVGIEWAFELNDDSTPVPDLIYVSFDRLSPAWNENTACPVAPELAIEIISPGQPMEQMAQKAQLYLAGGVDRVWVVDPVQQIITIFGPDDAPLNYRDDQEISDPLFPGLSIVPKNLFV